MNERKDYWMIERTIRINGIYHRCQACDNLVNDSAVAVMNISPTGDKITIYCSEKCFSRGIMQKPPDFVLTKKKEKSK